MLAASTTLNLPLYPIFDKRCLFFLKPRFSQSVSESRFSYRIRATAGDYDQEEVRWIREEQRWMREEKRWLREEQRWQAERELLLREISELKVRLDDLEVRSSSQGSKGVAETIENLASVLQVLKDADYGAGSVGRIAESVAGPSTIVLEVVGGEEVVKEVEEEKEVVVVKEIRVVESVVGEGKKVRRKVLKVGAEGEEVRALQVWL